jgi:thioredoxin 1
MVELTEESWEQPLPSGLPVLAFFWAPWSGPDRLLLPLLERIEPHFAGKVTFARVNVDENPDLAVRFQVTSVPTLLFFRGAPEPVRRVVGLRPEQEVVQAIYRVLES